MIASTFFDFVLFVNIIIPRYDLTIAMLVFYIERYVILTAEICMYDTVI